MDEFRYVPGSPVQDLDGVNQQLAEWFQQTYSHRLGQVDCDLAELTGLQAEEVRLSLALPMVPQTPTSDNSLLIWCRERLAEVMPADPTTPYLVHTAPVIEPAMLDSVEYQRLRVRIYVIRPAASDASQPAAA